jgi:hypothetical protein
MAKLSVIHQAPARDHPAPDHLEGVGLELWRKISAEYSFDDPASWRVLAEACFCTQRAERCREIIDRDGELLYVGKAVRSHPLLRDELGNRMAAVRCLQKLGLDLEPLHPTPGRPTGR